MNEKVKELVEQVRLTDEEKNIAVADWLERTENCPSDMPDYWEIVREAQLQKVLNHSDLALIDRERELPEPKTKASRNYNVGYYICRLDMLYANWKPTIPLAEAMKEATHETLRRS